MIVNQGTATCYLGEAGILDYWMTRGRPGDPFKVWPAGSVTLHAIRDALLPLNEWASVSTDDDELGAHVVISPQ